MENHLELSTWKDYILIGSYELFGTGIFVMTLNLSGGSALSIGVSLFFCYLICC